MMMRDGEIKERKFKSQHAASVEDYHIPRETNLK